eukprot:TRINITY_DN914_c2_g3_i1.p1 TRINITY_DN914_c2_g3~~TRINITY_DN914_c2_g3_i1.p1  ORF type:complete len:713 (+),score=217.84 TRINITY_DN914_c2_g3_i1:82-2139(+)
MPKRNYKDVCSAAFYGDCKYLEKLLAPKEGEEEVPIAERVRRREEKLNEPGFLVSWGNPVRSERFGLGFRISEVPPRSGRFKHRFKASKRSDDAATPLHWAVLGGEATCVLWLLRNGARSDLTSTRFASTPQDVAACNLPYEKGAREVADVFSSDEAAQLRLLESMKLQLDEQFSALRRIAPVITARDRAEVRPLQLLWMGHQALQSDRSAAAREPPAEAPRLLLPAKGEEPDETVQLSQRVAAQYEQNAGRGLISELSTNLGISPGRTALLMYRVANALRAAEGGCAAHLSPAQLQLVPDAALALAFLYTCEVSDLKELMRTVVPKPPKEPRPPPEDGEEPEPEPEPDPEPETDPALDDGTEGVPADEVPEEVPSMRQEIATAFSAAEDAVQLAGKWAVTIASLLGTAQAFSAELGPAYRFIKEPPEPMLEAVKALSPGDRVAFPPLTSFTPDPRVGESLDAPESTGLLLSVSGLARGIDLCGACSRYPVEQEVVPPALAVMEVEEVSVPPVVTAPAPAAGEAGEEGAEGGGEEAEAPPPADSGDAEAAPSNRTLLKLRTTADAVFDEAARAAFADATERAASHLADASMQMEQVVRWQEAHVARIDKAREVRAMQRGAIEDAEALEREDALAEEDACWERLRDALQEEYDAVAPPYQPPAPEGDGDADGEGGDAPDDDGGGDE